MSTRNAQKAMHEGRLGDARDHLLSLLGGPEDGPELRYNLAMVLIRLSDFAGAVPHLSRCLAAAPGNPDILCNLGNCQRLAGQLNDARATLDAALRVAPRHPGVLANRGWLLLATQQPQAALEQFSLLLSITPDSPDALRGHAESLAACGRLSEAIAALDGAVERLPSQASLLATLGALYARDRNIHLAYQRLDNALDIQPDNPETLLNHGICAEQLGDLERAEQDFRRALAVRPTLASAHFHLAHVRRNVAMDSEVTDIRRALGDGPATTEQIELEFALGKSLSGRGEFAEAFAAFSRARRTLSKQTPFPIEAALQRIGHIRNTRHSPVRSTAARSLFVIGMPRSGTTLVDQILASHPEAQSLGESGAVAKNLALYQEKLGRTYPDGMEDLGASDRTELSEALRQALGHHDGITVDTSPSNLLYAGLIAELLPEARFVYCQRDSRDTCVSIFEQPLSAAHGYANRLEDLGRYYSACFDLARHWQSLLGDRLYTARYEQLCESPESGIRKLLSACSLTFDEKCLEFHRHERAVITPSAGQVRQPISPQSIGRWQRYASELQPLIAQLPKDSYATA